MDRRHDNWRDARSHPLAALLADTEVSAQQTLCRAGAQEHDNLWACHFNFGVKPGTAGADLECAGFLMNAALAARLPLEVLDDVCHINVIAVDTCGLQCLVEHSAGGPNKRAALNIFFVAGLLSHHEYSRVRVPFAKNSLRAALPQVAAFANGCGFPQTW